MNERWSSLIFYGNLYVHFTTVQVFRRNIIYLLFTINSLESLVGRIKSVSHCSGHFFVGTNEIVIFSTLKTNKITNAAKINTISLSIVRLTWILSTGVRVSVVKTVPRSNAAYRKISIALFKTKLASYSFVDFPRYHRKTADGFARSSYLNCSLCLSACISYT